MTPRYGYSRPEQRTFVKTARGQEVTGENAVGHVTH